MVTGRDYSLVGAEAGRAVERGLTSGAWYRTAIPRKRMKELMQRRNGPALRDTALWLGLMLVAGTAGFLTWGTWWTVPCFAVYGILYGSSSDSRWHESGHGTAFRTPWMNRALYQVASFMIMREPTVWQWSHTRHHSETLIVGRDPEISAKRPPPFPRMALNVFGLATLRQTAKNVALHALGRRTAEEDSYVPDSEWPKVFREARIWLAIYGAVIVWAVISGSILPLMYIGLPSLYGAGMIQFFGLTQHAGLAEDVLDHRLNTRTVYMNPVFRFLYLNMNYHVEHHMFPMVPYHALPALHEEIKADTPPPYRNTIEAYREILRAFRAQAKDPTWQVNRPLPALTEASARS